MHSVSVADLVKKVGSTYKLVILTSLRAIELGDGAANLIGAKPDAKVINVAMGEISQGKISMKEKEKK
jgi:DNA-directed RNA polymerase omega subunit